MTNLPKFAERAEVARAVAAATNGKGLAGESITAGGVVIPKARDVEATADLVFRVADAICAGVVMGRQVQLAVNTRTGQGVAAAVPHFGQMLAKMREEWKEPDALQAAKLALTEALRDFQAKVYELAPRVVEAQKAAQAAADGGAQPLPPVEWGPGRVQMQAQDGTVADIKPAPSALACPTCGAESGHAAGCPDAPPA